MMPVTQRDIAGDVGMSQQAMSFALNGSPSISPAAHDHVFKAANELGYRQNHSASAMRRGRFHSLAYLSSTHRSRSHLSVPLWSGLQESRGERDLHLATSKHSDAEFSDPVCVPKVLRELSSDGTIIHNTQEIPRRLIDLVRDHNVPCIWASTRLDHDCVRPDDVAAGRLAAEHLLGLGHRESRCSRSTRPCTTASTSGDTASSRPAAGRVSSRGSSASSAVRRARRQGRSSTPYSRLTPASG